MSLGIAFKAPEGIVLAADSRVTLTSTTQIPNGPLMSENSSYDNATKLLQIASQKYVGAVTYGMGAISTPEPRTAHSFMPEFEKALAGRSRLSVEDFAKELSRFFLDRWNQSGNRIVQGEDMIFVVGGYDDAATFGKIFEFAIPNGPTPVERIFPTVFGCVWGGQREYADKLINGYDARMPFVVQQKLGLTDQQRDDLVQELANNFSSKIPWAFLPLQDCIDLVIFLIRTTITMQHFLVGTRGVGGAIDVAVITQSDGIRELQKKQLVGEQTR